MSNIHDIYKIGNQMKKIYQKVNLLRKKKNTMGLTNEEEKRLKDLSLESWSLHEELIETHLNITVMPYLTTKEYYDTIKEIQEIIPWDGGLIRKSEDYESITRRAIELTDEEKQFLADKLEYMHVMIMQRFELFCSAEEGYEHIKEASKVITSEEDGNVLDVLVYLDARYRELAELLDIELQEVEIIWEDDEDVEIEKDSTNN